MALRIGIIGSGFMGRTHAAAAKRCTGTELVGFAGGSRCQGLAEELGGKAFPDVNEFLVADEVDAFVLATPHQVHYEEAIRALRAGKHVLVDKPLTTTVEHARELIAEAEQRKLVLGLVYQQRNRSTNLAAKKLIDEGAIGRVRQIESFMLATNGFSKPWSRLPESVGWLLGYGVHQLALFRGGLGAEPETVYAVSDSWPDQRGPLPVETDSQIIMRFPRGIKVHLWCSTVVTPPGVSFGGTHIIGEKGIIEVQIGAGRTSVARDPDRKWEVAAQHEKITFGKEGMLQPIRLDAYQQIVQDFTDAVREKRQPKITGRDGLAGVVISLAAMQSSRENKAVKIEI